jgi:hypothetical protein
VGLFERLPPVVRDAERSTLTLAAPAFIVSVTTVASPASTSIMSSAIA